MWCTPRGQQGAGRQTMRMVGSTEVVATATYIQHVAAYSRARMQSGSHRASSFRSSQLDSGRTSSMGRASSTNSEPARFFEPARTASSQLDGSSQLDASASSIRPSQLDGGRAGSMGRASSTNGGPARFFEPARATARQVEPARSRPGQLEKSSWRDRVAPAPPPGYGLW